VTLPPGRGLSSDAVTIRSASQLLVIGLVLDQFGLGLPGTSLHLPPSANDQEYFSWLLRVLMTRVTHRPM
jgi:hypothetical protein